MKSILYLLGILLLIFSSCSQNESKPVRKTIDLSGEWQFQTDTGKVGINQKWFEQSFVETIVLPGTTDENKKGIPAKDTITGHLTRAFSYIGVAWYQREILIPENWNGKSVRLILERTKPTHVWLDTTYIGTNNSISAQQDYNLTSKLRPGKHKLTIRIDNDPKIIPVGVSHMISEDAQSNWNGIVGKLYLEASNPIAMSQVQIYPSISDKKIKVVVHTENKGESVKNCSLQLSASAWNTSIPHDIKAITYETKLNLGDNRIEIEYPMGDNMQLWSEFEPVMYNLNIALTENGKVLDNLQENFGMREFSHDNRHFIINGTKTFLRGKHDACVFPLTGYPPMDTASWIRIFHIAKSYGINHYRFHSWTPPKAAFDAADVVGMYLQPELPTFWNGFDSLDVAHRDYAINEGFQLFKNYGNSPSFAMLSLGNEFGGSTSVVHQIVDTLKRQDSRHLYAQGTNALNGWKGYFDLDDYWTIVRNKVENPDHSTEVRASYGFNDSKNGGIINDWPPSTTYTFDKALEGVEIPTISHETGQFQVYPNYDELEKYTGVLVPWNLEKFKDNLKKAGMLDQRYDFQKASGALAALCYKAEIETALRTKDMAGFQLLDLQDYPGHGTALVGMLDAFMDSKGIIEPKEFSQFCNDVVPLLVFTKYCWRNNETFSSEVQIANYGKEPIQNKPITWELFIDKKLVKKGQLNPQSIPNQGLSAQGNISFGLDFVEQATRADLKISIENTSYKNEYPIWIYPEVAIPEVPASITIAKSLSNQVIAKLEKGETVLLLPDFSTIKNNSVEGIFPTDFWNYSFFKWIGDKNNMPIPPGTMGLLMNPEHPVFRSFPTEFHSNWQWWSIVKNSRPLILDALDKDFRPTLQVIDNINRNHKMGLIFEGKVGKGKLLVCSIDFTLLLDKPEGKQFYSSILQYLNSKEFSPTTSFDLGTLKKILN